MIAFMPLTLLNNHKYYCLLSNLSLFKKIVGPVYLEFISNTNAQTHYFVEISKKYSKILYSLVEQYII